MLLQIKVQSLNTANTLAHKAELTGSALSPARLPGSRALVIDSLLRG